MDLNTNELKKKVNKGLVVVNTGEGKGKTTAAMGMIFRALGHGLRVCVIQFIKHENGQWGEVKTARALGIEWHKAGDGFIWKSKDTNESLAHAVQGWKLAQEKIASGAYNLVVLDEFTYPLQFNWLNTGEVIDWLKANKPQDLHLVITGRYAPDALVKYADLVSEIHEVKHPYQQGITAQAGIEF
jgi:cob(I)alamin adenosyltransferase